MDLSQILPTSLEWWQVLIAVAVVIVGWILSRLGRKTTIALMHRAPSVSEIIVMAVARIVSYTIVLLAIAVALAVLGVNMQPLLAIAVVLAAIAVLVLRGVADNFAAGVVIQASRPVVLGDEIQVEGPDGRPLTGVVTDLNSRTVVLETYDGRTVHVPNAKMVQDAIVNHSTRGMRRSEVQVRAARNGADSDDLLARIAGAAASVPSVAAEPAARTVAVSISPGRLTARVMFWHPPTDGLTTTGDVVRAVSAELSSIGSECTVTSDVVVPPLVPSDSV